VVQNELHEKQLLYRNYEVDSTTLRPQTEDGLQFDREVCACICTRVPVSYSSAPYNGSMYSCWRTPILSVKMTREMKSNLQPFHFGHMVSTLPLFWFDLIQLRLINQHL
jgi:hypothetical protein